MPPTFTALLGEVRRFWSPLPDKPEETPERLLCALWHTAAGAPVSVDRADPASLPPLDAEALERLGSLLERKRAGEPLAHLTRRQHFLGLEFLAGPDALIPRKETEILGRAALAKLACLGLGRETLTVLDVCTGSGNLALAYAWYEPKAQVFASDLCPKALAMAAANRRHLGLDARVELRQGDLLAPFDDPRFVGKCDLVSCNPPYISAARVPEMHPEISRHEPRVAFDGGVYGVSIMMKLLRAAPRFLKPASWLGFEVGQGQGDGMARQLEKHPAFARVETFRDAGGEIRAVFARSHAA